MKHISEAWPELFVELARTKHHGMAVAEIPHCRCESMRIRCRVVAGGSKQYAAQCLRCGRRVGNCVKRDSIENIDSVEIWDDSIEEDFDQRRRTISGDNTRREEKAREEFDLRWWALYNQYLSSRDWKLIRNQVIAREAGLCQGCREQRIGQVHHLTYERVGGELLTDLVGYCDDCHDKAHGRAA